MEVLGRQLMGPELLHEFIGVLTAEWNRQVAEAGLARRERRQALEEVERRITRLVDAIAHGMRAPGAALHPNLAEAYRAQVAALQQALADRAEPEALEAARALIDRVIVNLPRRPTTRRGSS